LAIVRRIAELHGGSLSVANCPDGGVALTLRIPRPVALEAAA
jgi:signal transduction histidine kinase